MTRPAWTDAGLRVGIAGSLSGVRTSHARFFRQAHRTLVRAGVEAMLGDDASSPARASVLAQEFVDAGVGIVIGHFNSACARVALPVYAAHGVQLMLPASTDIGLPLEHGVRRLCGDDAGQARRIAQRIGELRAREGGLPVRVRTDRSDYAQRLLGCLRLELGADIQAVLDLGAPATTGPLIEVVLATAARAVGHLVTAAPDGGGAITIYSDEAAVRECRQAARTRPGERYVVSPLPSYATLLARGCAWIADTALSPPGSTLPSAPRPGGWSIRRLG